MVCSHQNPNELHEIDSFPLDLTFLFLVIYWIKKKKQVFFGIAQSLDFADCISVVLFTMLQYDY